MYKCMCIGSKYVGQVYNTYLEDVAVVKACFN